MDVSQQPHWLLSGLNGVLSNIELSDTYIIRSMIEVPKGRGKKLTIMMEIQQVLVIN